MTSPTPPLRPPRAADALLHRWLPDGVVGLSILGDLHQEFEELSATSRLRMPRSWYWWNAVALSARYALVRFKQQIVEPGTIGSMAKETMMTWFADLKYGFRMLLKTPLLSAVAVITVALGVALTTHTFSSVHGSMIRGVPVPDHERLMFVYRSQPSIGADMDGLLIHDFEDVRERQSTFDGIAAFYQGTVNMAGQEGPPERFAGAYASDNFFSAVGVAPVLGRTLRAGDDGPDAPHVIVIGHHVWRNRFAGDPNIVGRMIRVNGQSTEIIGVMPEGFRFPFLEDVWLPHRIDAATLARGNGFDLDAFGRIREGITLDVARADLGSIANALAATYPDTNEGMVIGAGPYEDRYMPQEIQAVLWVMLFATFGVLLIACANVANLLMARASVRAREIAVRAALGAGRWRVVRQLLMESLALAAVGGVLGIALAWVGVDIYRNVVADIYKPYWIDFRMDVPVLLFSLGVTAVASVAAGIWPALRASGIRMGEVLKDANRSSSSLSMGRLSRSLVITEIAVSCALLVGAGFMIKSVVNLRNIELGFETEGVLSGRIGLFESDYPDPASRYQFFANLEERLADEPGVRSAALGTGLPGLGGYRSYVTIAGETYATDREYPPIHTTDVTAGYFETLGVELVRGRLFSPLETVREGDPVAIVNESFVARYLPGTQGLGEQLRLGRSGSTWPWLTIVGVVADTHIGGNVGGIGDDREPRERLYLPHGLVDASFMSFVVKTDGDPAALAPAMRQAVAELDPNLPVYELVPLGDAVEQATWAFGLFGALFTIFGAAALFMASVGLYGVMAFGVNQRRREMGVRMALGAEPPALLRMVLSTGVKQLAIGLVVGLGLGAAMSQPMSVIMYGVETNDPVVYVSIALALTAAGLLACVIPARAATRTDPIKAMRLD